MKQGKVKFDFDVPVSSTVLDVKVRLFADSGVRPERQKLLGLPKSCTDATVLSSVPPKPAGYALLLMGSTQEQLDSVQDSEEQLKLRDSVEDDLDLPDDAFVPPESRGEYLALIEKRIKSHAPKVLNPFVAGKKVLVLDIDYTLFDHRSVAERPHQLMRPYLHEFLTAVYPHYNIVIWSATGMSWIELKMRELGVTSNPAYSICCFMDRSAMIQVEAPKYGRFVTKPLGVLWGQQPEFASPVNTIMFDDLSRNFIMNPECGLKIRPCRDLPMSDYSDPELLNLTQYLIAIKDLDTFVGLEHGRWERYLAKRSRRE